MSTVMDPRAGHAEHALHRLEASRLRMLGELRAGTPTGRATALSTALRMAEHAGNESLRPMAERTPLTLVGIAAAGGALLMWARPWRTLAGSALLAGMLPQLGARMVSQIPIASLLDALTNVAGHRRD
jgi:hypothetical protein